MGIFHGFFKILNWLKTPIFFIFRIIKKILKILFWDIIVFLYRQYLKTKKNLELPAQTSQQCSLLEQRKVLITRRQYITSAIMIVLALLVIVNNFQIKNAYADEFNKGSIIYKIASEMAEFPEEIIDEEFYLGEFSETLIQKQTANLKSIPQLDPTDIYSEATEATIVQEGGALIKPIITTKESTTHARDEVVYHQVQSGETVGTIAEEYGISQNTILWANKLSARSYIRPGQKLKILPESGIVHKVKNGENIGKIAIKYKVDEEKIMSANKITNTTTIRIGEELMVPGGRPPYVPPKKTYVSTPSYSSAKISYSTLQWPTNSKRITQYYHWRHHAIDIGNKTGQPIYAAKAGTVTQALYSGWNGGYGLKVIIDHGGGKTTLYSHFSKVYVKKGEKVARGQVIGAIGSTGRSTGPHLHFEYRVNSSKLNPLKYLK